MSKKRSKIDLIFEKIPPIITFTLIFLPLWGGFIFPFATAYFVIIFNVFFLYKSISFAIYFALSLLKIRHTENIDWLSRLNELDDLDSAIELLLKKQKEIKNTKYSPFFEKIVFSYLKNKALRFVSSEIKRLNILKVTPPFINWKEMQHIVVIPHYKEPFHILEQTLIRISKNNYPTKNISIVLGAEARDTEGIKISKKLQSKFKNVFGNIWINSHVLTEDEIVFVICHVRKLNADRAPELDDLRNSSSLAQVPSVVMFLYRKKRSIDDLTENDYLENRGTLIIAKNRIQGRTGFIKIELEQSGEFRRKE